MESSLPGASLSVYRRFFTSAGDVRALERTLSLTAVVTVLALALGLFIAWELRLASGRRKSVILAIVVFPVWTSVIVRIYALTILFERHGIINNALVGAGIRDQPVQLLYTNKAVVVGMLYTVLPYATLPIYASLANVELELTAAAESLGASKTRAFWTIVVPLILPALVATGALVFVLGLGFYVTPLLLGNSTAPFLAGTISNDIFVFFDVPSAAAAGVVLIVIAFGCMAVTWRVVGVERLQRAVVA
ncbi:MAG TPA: ABC transporter permease [Gaiellaceae bacterium]